jgi:hypothetical protein
MIDLNTKNDLFENCELYAQKLEFWRLCDRGKCRRSRHCHDWARCILRIGEWYGAMQDAANRERNANDPAHMALVEDMKQRIMRLRQSTQGEQ